MKDMGEECAESFHTGEKQCKCNERGKVPGTLKALMYQGCQSTL